MLTLLTLPSRAPSARAAALLLPCVLALTGGCRQTGGRGGALRVPGHRVVRGDNAGGDRELNLNGCAGFVGNNPQHRLSVTEMAHTAIGVQAEGGIDTTLMVVGPKGEILCNDDRHPGQDENPLVSAVLSPGDYEIYVGTYAQQSGVRYDLVVNGGTDVTNVGTYGALTAPGRMSADGAAGGPRNAESVYGGPCYGWVDTSQDHALTVTQTSTVVLDVDVPSGVDTTLVVVGNGRTWCTDDRAEGDMDPLLAAELPPGTYEVYVGTYDQMSNYPQYQLRMLTW